MSAEISPLDSLQYCTPSDAWNRLAEFLGVLRLQFPTGGVLQRAKSLHLMHVVSFWDALILAACLDSDIDIF